MIAAIMQPYFFPYLGYFQLLRAADIFIFHDDVQYIKAGWVNRNRILLGGQAGWLTLPVRSAEHTRAINERYYVLEPAVVGDLLRKLEAAYRQAPQFTAVFPIVREIMEFESANVAAFNINLVSRLCRKLGIAPRFYLASALEKDHRLTGQERVIELCRRVGASCYVNPIGGRHLYDRHVFAHYGIQLRFLKANVISGRRDPFLSIIDVLMFHEVAAIENLLSNYEVVDT